MIKKNRIDEKASKDPFIKNSYKIILLNQSKLAGYDFRFNSSFFKPNLSLNQSKKGSPLNFCLTVLYSISNVILLMISSVGNSGI